MQCSSLTPSLFPVSQKEMMISQTKPHIQNETLNKNMLSLEKALLKQFGAALTKSVCDSWAASRRNSSDYTYEGLLCIGVCMVPLVCVCVWKPESVRALAVHSHGWWASCPSWQKTLCSEPERFLWSHQGFPRCFNSPTRHWCIQTFSQFRENIL